MWRSAGAAHNRSLGRPRKPLAGHYDPCCQELAARAPQEMAGPETRTRGPKSPGKERREARRPDRKGRRGASQAPPVCRVTAHQPVPRKHRAPVGAPPTPRGVDNLQTPGAIASRERESACGEQQMAAPIGCHLLLGLFDIVKKEMRLAQ